MSNKKTMSVDVPVASPKKIAISDIRQIQVPSNNGIPNHPFLSALIYPKCFDTNVKIDEVKALYEKNGWFGVWDWSVFEYHHFHPASHEVLTCVQGSGMLHLGGEDGPKAKFSSGDCLILPAGFGHKLLMSAEEFRVVGGYPEGQEDYKTLRADDSAAKAAKAAILATSTPVNDPVYGADGPLKAFWTDRRTR